ncbi:M949_RS01915 family surface polysaccharide biosynthesis protein [Emticicia fontis]
MNRNIFKASAKTIIIFLIGFKGFCQSIAVQNIPVETLTKFNILGVEVIKKVQFKDKNGLNYLIATTEENTKDDYTTKKLWVEHFLEDGSKTPKLLREITDFERDCPVDNQLSLITDSFTIADLDKNGYAEIIFLYKTGCKGDVSPSGLKLMILENGNKAAIRGSMIIKEFKTPREMAPDAAFKKLPKVIKDKAYALWSKFENEY